MSIYLYGNASSSLPPHQEGILVGDGLHSIYWSESGNPAGIPVLVIRGFGFWQAAASRCFDFDEHARNSDEDAMNVAQTGRSLLHP